MAFVNLPFKGGFTGCRAKKLLGSGGLRFQGPAHPCQNPPLQEFEPTEAADGRVSENKPTCLTTTSPKPMRGMSLDLGAQNHFSKKNYKLTIIKGKLGLLKSLEKPKKSGSLQLSSKWAQ